MIDVDIFIFMTAFTVALRAWWSFVRQILAAPLPAINIMIFENCLLD